MPLEQENATPAAVKKSRLSDLYFYFVILFLVSGTIYGGIVFFNRTEMATPSRIISLHRLSVGTSMEPTMREALKKGEITTKEANRLSYIITDEVGANILNDYRKEVFQAEQALPQPSKHGVPQLAPYGGSAPDSEEYVRAGRILTLHTLSIGTSFEQRMLEVIKTGKLSVAEASRLSGGILDERDAKDLKDYQDKLARIAADTADRDYSIKNACQFRPAGSMIEPPLC